MRKLLFVMLLAVLATPAYGQQLASVKVTAHLEIPDFLNVRVGATEVIDVRARRVTLYVTANRAWQLFVDDRCTGDACDPLDWRVVGSGEKVTVDAVRVLGGNGNDIPVVIEYRWDEGDTPPSAEDLQYLLTTG